MSFESIKFFSWPKFLEYHFNFVDQKSLKESRDFCYSVFKEAHVFIIPDLKQHQSVPLSHLTVPLDIPFPSCVFECAEDKTLSIGGISENHEAKYEFDFLGVFEFAPNQYFYFGWGYMEINNRRFPPQMFFSSSREIEIGRVRLAQIMNARLKLCIEILNRQSMQVGRLVGKRKKVKIKINGQKEFLKFKPITVVRPKNTSLSSSLKIGSSTIDWSHRWEVRGHWRRTEGIGKNREGEYQIKGFTWVKNHVKGPEIAPLLKTTRLVKTS